MTAVLIGLALLASGTTIFVVWRKWSRRYRTNGPITDGQHAQDWLIGPIVWGENRSKGTPLHPSPEPGALFAFDFPEAPGHVHAATFRHGPITGKSRIRMRYRIETDPGAQIVPLTDVTATSKLTLYFQKYGDDWSGEGKHETDRWYAYFATQEPILNGQYEIVAPFTSRWNAVQSSDSWSNPEAFAEALKHADQVGIAFGGGSGLGHGAYAIGRARIVVQEFMVE
jgi:hypothetical protein